MGLSAGSGRLVRPVELDIDIGADAVDYKWAYGFCGKCPANTEWQPVPLQTKNNCQYWKWKWGSWKLWRKRLLMKWVIYKEERWGWGIRMVSTPFPSYVLMGRCDWMNCRKHEWESQGILNTAHDGDYWVRRMAGEYHISQITTVADHIRLVDSPAIVLQEKVPDRLIIHRWGFVDFYWERKSIADWV